MLGAALICSKSAEALGSTARGGAASVPGWDTPPGELVRHLRMKPRRNPAGTRSLPRARLKATKRSQIIWVSTFQQGRTDFAALISSAQQVWKTFDGALISICPVKTVLFLEAIDSDVSAVCDTTLWESSPVSKTEKRKSQGAY